MNLSPLSDRVTTATFNADLNPGSSSARNRAPFPALLRDYAASLALASLVALAGCTNAPQRADDITLAETGTTQSPLQPTLRASAGAVTGSTLVTGSGATTNVVIGSAPDNVPSAMGAPAADAPRVGLNTAVASPVAAAGSSISPVATQGVSTPSPGAPTSSSRPPRLGKAISVGAGTEPGAPANAVGASSTASPAAATSLPSRVVTSVRTKPGCVGAECPTIKVRRIMFSGRDRFTVFLEEALVSMAEIDTSNSAPFRTMAEFERNFWRVAKPRYEVVLESGVRRDSPDIIVVQLDSYVFAGGAHGMSTTQYINWLPKVDRLLSLETMLLPRMMKQFEATLARQHTQWLKTNPIANENPESYNKLWPFKVSDNAALLAEGLAITYDPTVIAPYSYGRPTLIIPYSELNGILRPELLPK